MRRIAFLVLAFALLPLQAKAAEPERIYRVGFLWVGSTDGSPSPWIESFRQGMRDLGYAEGKNLLIAVRDAKGRVAGLPGAAAELAELRVEVIVTGGTTPTLAAMQVTSRIPIVFGAAENPVGRGIVASLALPGGNVTGLSIGLTVTKALALLKEIKPSTVRVGFLYHTANTPPHYLPTYLAERGKAAQALGMTLVPVAVQDAEDLERAFGRLQEARVDALLTSSDPMLVAERKRVSALILQSRLPASCGQVRTELGCLISYGEDLADNFRRAAGLVDKILKGGSAATLPVEQATKFTFILNLKTAKLLDLIIPTSLLTLADEVIE